MVRAMFDISDFTAKNESGENIVYGYAAKYEKFSLPMNFLYERIRKGTFTKSISKNNIFALWNHNRDIILGSVKGKTLKLSEDDTGLFFELKLPKSNSGNDVFEVIQRGDVCGVSFGFCPVKWEWDFSDPNKIIRTLLEVDLIEISPTAFPAYPDTTVKPRSIYEDYVKELEDREMIIKNKDKLLNKLNYLKTQELTK